MWALHVRLKAFAQANRDAFFRQAFGRQPYPEVAFGRFMVQATGNDRAIALDIQPAL